MKKIILPLLIVLLALLCWGGYRLFFAPSSANLTLYGNVDIRESALGFRVSGRLAHLHYEEGDHVNRGARLAQLDDAPYRDKLASAKADVAALKGTLEKLIAGPRQSEIDQARALAQARQAQLTNGAQDLQRVKQLRAEKTVSQSDLDRAIAIHDGAKAELAAANSSLQYLLEGSRQEDIETARANLQKAEAQYQIAQTALTDTILLAPADGTIRSRIHEAGTILETGTPIYILALDQPLRVRGYIGETDLGRIKPGTMVEVTTDSAPDHIYQGKVGFVSPSAEFTPKSVETPKLRSDLVYRFWVTIEEGDTALRQGMPVTITVKSRQ